MPRARTASNGCGLVITPGRRLVAVAAAAAVLQITVVCNTGELLQIH